MTKKLQSITSKIPAIVALALIVLAWYLLCVSGLVPAYMLPSPVNVAKALISDMPLILMHARYTLQEAFYGLCIGILLAFVSATLMDRFLTINRAFYPLMVITQTIPTGSGTLDGLWHGTEDRPGGYHHLFSDCDRSAGRL